jgi:hypothetical protein
MDDDWKNIGQVTCLACGNGAVWMGTDKNGLWRCRLIGNQWQHWGREEGLPDEHIESITVDDAVAYVGVGTSASGGLAGIAADNSVDIFEGPAAPKSAPTHVILCDDRILARTLKSIEEYNIQDQNWKRLPIHARWNPVIFPGSSGIWGSRLRKELYRFDPFGVVDDRFKRAWFPAGRNKAGYAVRFLIERDNETWVE